MKLFFESRTDSHLEFIKNDSRTVFDIQPDGSYEIKDYMFLTAYNKESLLGKRIVSNREAQEIMGRLLNKGYELTRRK